MGVYAEEFLAPVAEAFQELGTVHSIVMHSEDGLDEISISAATRGYEISGMKYNRSTANLNNSVLKEWIECW